MISPVRKTRAVGKPAPRLIGVVHGPIDAVAEPELAREEDGQPAVLVTVVVGLDRVDELAVVALGEDARDFVLEVEALTEDDWGHELKGRRQKAEGKRQKPAHPQARGRHTGSLPELPALLRGSLLSLCQCLSPE